MTARIWAADGTPRAKLSDLDFYEKWIMENTSARPVAIAPDGSWLATGSGLQRRGFGPPTAPPAPPSPATSRG